MVRRSLGHVSFFEFMRLDILENFKNNVYIYILYPKLSIPIWFILIIRNTIFIHLFAIVLFHKYAGVERDKTMADNLIYIPNDGTLNYHFCRL